MTPSAIRRRLTLWNLGVFGLVVVLMIAAAVITLAQVTDLGIDRDLQRGAARAATRMAHRWAETTSREREEHADEHDHDRASDEADEHHAAFADDAPNQITIAARIGEQPARPDGQALPAGLPDRGALEAALRGREARSSGTVDGVAVRILSLPVRHDGEVIGAVQVARALSGSQRSLWRSIVVLVFTGGVGLLFAAAASAFLATRAMRPIRDALDRQRRFLADASHELRTPVAVLRARIELLQREHAARLESGAREELDRLRTDADELGTLLGEVLDLARLDERAVALTLEPVAIGDVAEELVASLAPLSRELGITLSAVAAPVFARADLGRLRQVLRALIDNAFKHTPRGGHVEVRVSRDSDRARIRVVDDGEGIASEDLPHVFERFFRADASRTRAPGSEAGGAGLGLAIARELVDRMDGAIDVASTPGQGATFTIALPLAGTL